MTRRITLTVNDRPVQTDYFVQSFIDHTVGGMVEALEGTGPIVTLNVAVEGVKVIITLNDNAVPINPFVTKIMRNTIVGMVSSLKGVGEMNRLSINIQRDIQA